MLPVRGSARRLAWLVFCFITPARADPQFSAGLTLGMGGSRLRGPDPIPAFHIGARADVLFLRRSDRSMAIGPYVEALSVAFETFEVGGGVSWLIPLGEHFPLVLSAGTHARAYPGGWEPGVHGMLFFGSRSYNFSSLYGMAGGLFVEGRWGLGDGQQADFLVGALVDFELLTLPFVLLVNAFR